MIDKLLRTGITNLWNLADFYRLKGKKTIFEFCRNFLAECLTRIFSQAMPLNVVSEVIALLDMSIQAAEEAELVVSAIKALTLLLKMNLEEEKMNVYKVKIQQLCTMLAAHCVKNSPPFLREAQQFVNV